MSNIERDSQRTPKTTSLSWANGRIPSASDMNEAIAESLQRQFRPPPMPPLLRQGLELDNAHVAVRSPKPSPGRARSHSIALSALAFCLSGIAVWLWIDRLSEQSEHGYQYHVAADPFSASKPLVNVYNDTVAAGFQPGWLCDDDREFAATFHYRHGQPLALRTLPEGSRMLGLAYYGGFSSRTTSLLCEVDSQPVMVLIDNLDARVDETLIQPTDQLNVFSRTLGGFVLFEVTPFDAPRVLAMIRVPDSPR